MAAAAESAARRRWLLLRNETAGGRFRAAEAARLASCGKEAGIEVDLVAPVSAEDGTERVREAARSGGYDAILAFGGDGTVAAAAAGLLGTGVPLGVVPGGTVNVLAREIGLPLDPERAFRALFDARPRLVDVGFVRGRPFLLMAGAGLDAAIMRDVQPRVKRLIGRGAVALTAISKMLRGGFPRFRVEIGGESFEVSNVVASSGRLYGGSFVIAPEADLSDGLLDVVLFAGSRRRDLLRYLVAIAAGRHLDLPDVRLRRAAALRILPVPGAPAGAIQLDGDYVFDAPVDVELRAGALELLVPARG
jgi:diacylglycerol kinase family enzyme